MKPLSIDSNSFLSPLLPSSRAFDGHRRSPAHSNPFQSRPQPTRGGAAGWFTPTDDSVSNGLFLGLVALTLPTVGYAFYQLWHLVGGETLNQAVRAFAP